MKKNNAPLIQRFLKAGAFFSFVKLPRFRPGPALAALAAFFAALILIIGGRSYTRLGVGDIQDFEVGRVAERDVIAERTVSYTDWEATRRRMEDRERMVPAVFTVSVAAGEAIRRNYGRFLALLERLFGEGLSRESFRSVVEVEFPAAFSVETLNTLFVDEERDRFPLYGLEILQELLDTGIVALPEEGLDDYNPDILELYRTGGVYVEREQIAYDRIITRETSGEFIVQYAGRNSYPASFILIAPALLGPFISENVFFSLEETQRQLVETRNTTEPVIKLIERGKRVIRKGFIVTEEDMIQLHALNATFRGRDPRVIIGQILVLLLLYTMFAFLGSRWTLGKQLNPAEVYLICVLAVVYIGGTVFFRNLVLVENLPGALFVPTALVVMLPSILIGLRSGVLMATILPLIAFLTGSYDTSSYIFALTSGIAAAFTMQKAEKRMDLVKAGFIIGAANCIASIANLLVHRNSIGDYPVILFWSAFNGIASGMLILGFLPMLENALSAVTRFRLIELSDLNAPVLKRLFSVAPGTYSHSVMVANLAETACQEIGANPLLARVGAYYHDIGKMEQPDYFVENQTAYNKHNDISPRLSVTVIRSHVKLGAEKARSMGLPQAVIDIILEHHGNSVITWFYNAALKREGQVNVEDFSYPGNPPRTRESAVVMLADVTEAAVRVLKRPTAARLEKYIQELIMAKFEHGQLSESELTFRDLETIKKAFVRVLAGHYHSRIEYPKLPKEGASGGGRDRSDGGKTGEVKSAGEAPGGSRQ
jgi:putative nucleotidyltransferase with HDIG domain